MCERLKLKLIIIYRRTPHARSVVVTVYREKSLLGWANCVSSEILQLPTVLQLVGCVFSSSFAHNGVLVDLFDYRVSCRATLHSAL